MESLEQVNPYRVKTFFVNLCAVSSRYEKKHHAIEDLDNQLEKIKKYSKGKLDTDDIPGLKSKINEVLESERKILGHTRAETAKVKDKATKVKNIIFKLIILCPSMIYVATPPRTAKENAVPKLTAVCDFCKYLS